MLMLFINWNNSPIHCCCTLIRCCLDVNIIIYMKRHVCAMREFVGWKLKCRSYIRKIYHIVRLFWSNDRNMVFKCIIVMLILNSKPIRSQTSLSLYICMPCCTVWTTHVEFILDVEPHNNDVCVCVYLYVYRWVCIFGGIHIVIGTSERRDTYSRFEQL